MNHLTNKQKDVTKLFSVIAAALLLLTAVTLLLAPTESANSSFTLQLQNGEPRIKLVDTTTAPGSYVDFLLELQDESSDSSTHEITLSIVNLSYDGSSEAAHWQFTFPDADTGGDTYYVDPSQTETVTFRVTFLGTVERELVTFTLIGSESAVGDPTPDGNHTYLTPRDCTLGIVQYLTVISSDDYNPYWEQQSCADGMCTDLPCSDIGIILWNLGAQSDTLSVDSWEVWQDVNEDGIIDSGDVQNTFFDLSFESGTGSPYVVGDPIPLTSGSSLDMTVLVTSDADPANVPEGYYLIRITVHSDGSAGDFTDTIESYKEGHPEICATMITFGPGWNLISMPVGLDPLGTTYTASVLAAEINAQAGDHIIHYVVRYQDNAFQEYVVDADIGRDFPIELGRGYYVFSASPFTVDFAIAGDCLEGCDATVDFTACWNLIGWSSSRDDVTVGEFADTIDNHAGQVAVQAIIWYDTDANGGAGAYITWYPAVDADDAFVMTPGRGYWMFVATDLYDVPYP